MFLSCYTKLWVKPARSYHRQVKDWGNWALGAALRPKTRHEGVQCDKKYMPYHSFFLGGAHRLQAIFWACGVDRGQSYGNIEDNWRFLPADESTRVDAPAIIRRPPPW